MLTVTLGTLCLPFRPASKTKKHMKGQAGDPLCCWGMCPTPCAPAHLPLSASPPPSPSFHSCKVFLWPSKAPRRRRQNKRTSINLCTVTLASHWTPYLPQEPSGQAYLPSRITRHPRTHAGSDGLIWRECSHSKDCREQGSSGPCILGWNIVCLILLSRMI